MLQAFALIPDKGQIVNTQHHRRALLQSTNTAAMQVSNIPSYNPGPQQPSTVPPLAIPIIFHVMLYQ